MYVGLVVVTGVCGGVQLGDGGREGMRERFRRRKKYRYKARRNKKHVFFL